MKQLEETAYHEAGHAAVSIYHQHRIGPASIKPKGDTAGRIVVPRKSTSEALKIQEVPRTAIRYLEHLEVLHAGYLAERIKAGRSSRIGASGDHNVIFSILSAWCLDRAADGPEGQALWKWTQIRAEYILRLVWPAVEAIAAELLEKQEITGKRARLLYREAQMKAF